MGTFILGSCNLDVLEMLLTSLLLVTAKVLSTAFTPYYCVQIITKELFKQ